MKKNSLKISLTTSLLILCLIIIFIMSFFIVNLYKKINSTSVSTNTISNLSTSDKKISNTIVENENTIANSNTEVSLKNNIDSQNTSNKIAFSDLMNLIYPKSSFKNGNTTYKSIISEKNVISISNANEKLTGMQYYDITYYPFDNDSVVINIVDTEKSLNTNFTISGIDEEIVDIKVISDPECKPSQIYFLTRNGNVYYTLNNNFLESSKNITAKKINKLYQITSIKLTDALSSNAYESSTNIIAITYNGNYEFLNSYIN